MPRCGGGISGIGKIRGRGNATWTYVKKPYKFKFQESQSLFGFAPNKDWVLLAEYRDKSLMRTACMCELSKLIGLSYTINYKHVDFFLNSDYMGTYLLTDLVEKSKNRVDISKDGFLIEKDNWYNDEPLWFTTSFNHLSYTFKYPDANNGDIQKDDKNYLFIVEFMNELEKSMLKLETDSMNLDYLQFINADSFAKWAILAQLTCTWDPNIYYYLPSKNEKMNMGPFWDVEYSFGEWTTSWGDSPEPMEEQDVLKNMKYYFHYLLKSPHFKHVIQRNYFDCRESLNRIQVIFEVIENEIQYSQIADYNKWWNSYYSVNPWHEELEMIKSFFNKRLLWCDSFFENII